MFHPKDAFLQLPMWWFNVGPLECNSISLDMPPDVPGSRDTPPRKNDVSTTNFSIRVGNHLSVIQHRPNRRTRFFDIISSRHLVSDLLSGSCELHRNPKPINFCRRPVGFESETTSDLSTRKKKKSVRFDFSWARSTRISKTCRVWFYMSAI